MRFVKFLVLFLVPVTLTAQTGGIKGTAFDQAAESPLPFVSVSLHMVKDSSLLNGQLSGSDGSFLFEGLKPGHYFLRLQFLGYQTVQTDPVQVQEKSVIDLGKVPLKVNPLFLEEVNVTGKQLQNINTIDKQVYRAQQFESARGGTAMDVLRNLPSVTVDGQGQLTLRGAQGFLLLVNGKPVQTDASTFLSQLSANQIENIELITSPSARYDPDGRGGIINITTKKGAADGFALIANVQGGLPSFNDYDNAEPQQRYGFDLTASYRQRKWDLAASLNYLRNDNAGQRDGDVYTIIGNRKTTFPSLGERSFDKYNYGARLSAVFTPDSTNQFSAGFYIGHKFQDRIADIYYNNTTTDLNTGNVIGRNQYFNANLQNKQGDFILGNLDYSHLFHNRSRITLSLLYERAGLHGATYNRNIVGRDTLQNTISTYENPLDGFRSRIDYSLPLGPGKFETGYQYRLDQQDGQFIYSVKEAEERDFSVIPEFSGNVKALNQIHSVYTQYSGKSGRAEFSGGVRYEYAHRDLDVISTEKNNYQLTLNNLFPSANLLYNFSDNLKGKAGFSRRVQRTNNFELNPIPEREHSETLEQGDANLLPEFINLAEVGIVRNFNGGSLFSNLYFQDIKNPIQRVNSVYADTILNRVFTNADRTRRFGIEAGTSIAPTKRIQFYLGANLYHSRTNGLVLDYVEERKNQGWVYSINGNAGFQLTRDFSMQANLNYISARPTVQGEDSRFFSPNLSLKHTFLSGAMTATLQWQNIGLGVLSSNEQRITTWAPDFYTTTNYIYEKDVVLLNLSFNLNRLTRQLKLPSSEFGEKEF